MNLRLILINVSSRQEFVKECPPFLGKGAMGDEKLLIQSLEMNI